MMVENIIVDLLKHAHENQPNDFQTAFQDIMQDKISAAIDAKREGIAQQMMNGAEEDDFDLNVDLDDEPDVDITEY